MSAPPTNTPRWNRYRLGHVATVAGSFAVGMLVVNRLVASLHEDFSRFYGVSGDEYRAIQETANAQLPVTVGHLTIAAIALLSVCAFIAIERRRIRRLAELDDACRQGSTEVVHQRLSGVSLFDAFVLRTSAFAGVLLAGWLLQTCLERWLGGFGWSIEYQDWRSLLPLASVFGVCVLAGMLVAGVSMVGLRAIGVLEVALAQMLRAVFARVASTNRPARVPTDLTRTVRERIGYDILSRPPPLAC